MVEAKKYIPAKTRGLVILESVLFAVCLGMIALRATVTEGLSLLAGARPMNIEGHVFSLLLSGILIFSFVIWLIFNICSRQFCYRPSFLEIGLILFIVAAVAASLTASNKRAAITESIVVIAPMCMAVLLVQLLDCRFKIKLLLAVIAALGILQSYQCTDQLFHSNQLAIEEYESSPERFLAPLGIETGTFQQWLFEHRLYTRAVNGFFTNKNSVGCFFIMAAYAAFVLFAAKFKAFKQTHIDVLPMFCSAAAFGFILWGLLITKSKGAILAAFFSAFCFTSFLLFPQWLKKHRKAVFLFILLFIILVCVFIVNYGLSHGRLPGGNSMLVRWQYWSGTAELVADHPLTGVGPGNFPFHFTRYKLPGALESVADPHNIVLSFLAKYGPLGLLAFVLMLLVPFAKVITGTEVSAVNQTMQTEIPFMRVALPFILIIVLLLLCIRPFLVQVAAGQAEVVVKLYIFFSLYVVPVMVFFIGFWLVSYHLQRTEWFRSSVPMAALFCAVLAVLVQNLIDFAIFEPGVSTCFWALVACLLALNTQRKEVPAFVFRFPKLVKLCSVVFACVVIAAFFTYALVPVINASVRTRQALETPGFPHHLLEQAAHDDKYDPLPLSINGKLYLERYRREETVQPQLLQNAVDMFKAAIERNPADYKNHERLTEAYLILSESDRRKRREYLQKAFETADQTIDLYPGCARIHFLKASIAEILGKNDIALAHYKRTVEIEKAFLKQFALMYPEEEIISRLGNEKYELAKQKINRLNTLEK